MENICGAGQTYTYTIEDELNIDGGKHVLAMFLQSNQVKRTPQELVNEFVIKKLNPLLVVDFRLISAFLYA